jgi:hypothetical protein
VAEVMGRNVAGAVNLGGAAAVLAAPATALATNAEIKSRINERKRASFVSTSGAECNALRSWARERLGEYGRRDRCGRPVWVGRCGRSAWTGRCGRSAWAG